MTPACCGRPNQRMQPTGRRGAELRPGGTLIERTYGR